jgi:hypothetical protein
MTRHDPGTVRCLLVWLLATTVLALLAPWLLAGLDQPRDFERTLVDLMSLAGAAAGLWLWLLTSITTYDVARGQAARTRSGVPLAVRRLVLGACGVALVSNGLGLPAFAEDGHHRHSVLSGLPLPDRPTTLGNLGLAFQLARGPVHPTHHEARAEPGSRPGTVVVRAGDTLWAIAQQHLAPRADDDAVGRACSRLFELNRAVIGDDPDLIHPGQRLRLPDLTQEDS